MRLLIDASAARGTPVGIARYLQRITPPLSRMCEVTVLSSDTKLFANSGSRIITIPDWTRTNSGRVFWELACLRRFCSAEHDVLLCSTPFAPPGVALPKIAIVHDLMPLVTPRLHLAKHKALFWLSVQTLRWADAVVAVSEHTKTDLTTRLNLVPLRRVSVVPEGPGVIPAHPDTTFASAYKPYVLYVGGHGAHKNVRHLLAAFARLTIGENLRLVVVGWGSKIDTTATRDAVRRYRLTDRVVMLSDLDDSQLSSLYSGCQAFVFPSLYEGFGLPVLEALAHGAPTACSGTSSLPEVAGEAAVYFDPLSVSDITRKIELLLENHSVTEALRKAGPRRAAHFSWETAAVGILRVAQELLRESERPNQSAGRRWRQPPPGTPAIDERTSQARPRCRR